MSLGRVYCPIPATGWAEQELNTLGALKTPLNANSCIGHFVALSGLAC